jgi:hypothetical protein
MKEMKISWEEKWDTSRTERLAFILNGFSLRSMKNHSTGSETQMVERLPAKQKDLSSVPTAAKKKRKIIHS